MGVAIVGITRGRKSFTFPQKQTPRTVSTNESRFYGHMTFRIVSTNQIQGVPQHVTCMYMLMSYKAQNGHGSEDDAFSDECHCSGIGELVRTMIVCTAEATHDY